MNQTRANIVRAFLQGLTGGGLFRRLDYPGAPTEFVDSRSVSDVIASGEFRKTCLAHMSEEAFMTAIETRIKPMNEFNAKMDEAQRVTLEEIRIGMKEDDHVARFSK